ncbi:MAG: hypothetical protein DME26_18475 [Verrucomicrobia bacterium]|nr:MAG: hypothetical protein DME26_18475 [Verrucomicrobiota bacterium]
MDAITSPSKWTMWKHRVEILRHRAEVRRVGVAFEVPAARLTSLRLYGSERLWMNSECDRGISEPLVVPHAALEMKMRGHSADAVNKMIFENPKKSLGQCPRFRIG